MVGITGQKQLREIKWKSNCYFWRTVLVGPCLVYISAYIRGMIYVDKYFILDGYITQVSTNTNTRAEHLHFL